MEYTNPLGVEKVSKLLYKFSLPAIVGMMVNGLYNVVDRIFIGNSGDLGSDGLGAITIGFPIMILLLAIGVLFGIGGATLFSIRLGEKREKEAEEALGHAFVSLIVAGILFMILGQIFLPFILEVFGASEDIFPYAMEYMRVIFCGAVFQIVSLGMNNFIRADGQPKIAMMTMFFGAGTNIFLDALFIFGFKMGMTGAALATIMAQFFSSIWVVSYFLGNKCRVKLKLKHLKLKFSVVSKIIMLGLPGFFLQLANSVLNIVLNKSLLLYGGDIAVSGMGVINSLQTILLMPIIGIRQGMQPIISFNYGAKKFDRVKTAIFLANISATLIVVIGYLLTRLFPTHLIGLFNSEEELLAFGTTAIMRWFLCLPVVGFQIITSNFFQAIGRAGAAMFLSLTRQVILLIPAIIVFSNIWGLEGLLYAAPFADFFSMLLTASWFYLNIKKLGHETYQESTVPTTNVE